MLKPIPGAPVAADSPSFPSAIEPAHQPPNVPTPLPSPLGPSPAHWATKYGSLRLALNPLQRLGDTLFMFDDIPRDAAILLTGDRADFVMALRKAAPAGWDVAPPSTFTPRRGLMALSGDPKFRYFLSFEFSFAVDNADLPEDRRGVRIAISREEPPAAGRKNPTQHGVISLVAARADLVRLFAMLGAD